MNIKTAYLTYTEAQNYFDGRLDVSVWTSASNSDKTKALIQASTDIDKLQYIGYKKVNTQEHEFPRLWQDSTIDEILYDSDEIPLLVKYAVCEQALALLDGFDVNKEIDSLSLSSENIGSVKTTYDRSFAPLHLKCGLCALAFQNLLPFIRDQRCVKVLRA